MHKSTIIAIKHAALMERKIIEVVLYLKNSFSCLTLVNCLVQSMGLEITLSSIL